MTFFVKKLLCHNKSNEHTVQDTLSFSRYTPAKTSSQVRITLSFLVRSLLVLIIPVSTFAETYHVLEPSENLTVLSEMFDVSVESIVEVNSLGHADNVVVGQKIIIPMSKRPKKNTSEDKLNDNTINTKVLKPIKKEKEEVARLTKVVVEAASIIGLNTSVKYRAQQGDTLQRVVTKFNVDLADFIEINNLYSDYSIVEGDLLLIPSAKKDGKKTDQPEAKSNLTIKNTPTTPVGVPKLSSLVDY